ncbi:MAG: hypothetical protein KDC54_06360 [Lewinella sp.]|nr:hypothetical protein [Lewinella sp.]
MRIPLLLGLGALLTLSACIEPVEELPGEAIGLAPIYAAEEWDELSIGGPEEILHLGKIYYKAPYIYATDRGRGIHIVDNSDPTAPERIGFIHIPGNSDLAIRNNILYANNVNDLVAIDISRRDSLVLVSRLTGVFEMQGTEFPLNYSGYFECPDPQAGLVVGWYETSITKPECWR